MREETRCHHIGYSSRLAARVLLYASSHRQDNTYHGLCYTSCGALAGTRNSPMGPPWRIDPTTHRTMSERSYHGATSRSPHSEQAVVAHTCRPYPVPLSGTGKEMEEGVKGGGGGGTACTGGYKWVRAVWPESVAGGWWFEVLWNLECPVGLSQRKMCVHFNEGNLAQFGRGPPKNKEFSRSKSGSP